MGKRGSCEISSYVFDFFRDIDSTGVKTVDLFSDGCGGQNLNSVVPDMASAFVADSQNVESITFHYFETNHGQSECDSIHSVIEQKVSRLPEILHPSHLAGTIKDARNQSEVGEYTVKCVCTSDILDWK